MSSVVDFATTAYIFENGNNGFDVFDNPDDSTINNRVRISGEGDDFVSMNGGDDHILTGAGDDNILGGAGNDYIDGGAGTDIIDGGAGNDTILGGSGADQLIGGEGDDIFTFQFSDFADGSTDSVLDFEVGDKLIVNGSDSFTLEGDEIKLDGETIIKITGGVPDGVTGEYTDDDTFELF